MVVQHNLTAMNSNRMLGLTTSSQAKATEKLSSGYKINRAADDAAGLAISEKMRKQIRGLTQASSNAQDGISAVQTAEGALTEVHDMLQRMNELAVKAANGTMSESDRAAVQSEIDQLVTEIDRVSTTTKFNETYLLKGANNGVAGSLTFNTAAGALSGVGKWNSETGIATISVTSSQVTVPSTSGANGAGSVGQTASAGGASGASASGSGSVSQTGASTANIYSVTINGKTYSYVKSTSAGAAGSVSQTAGATQASGANTSGSVSQASASGKAVSVTSAVKALNKNATGSVSATYYSSMDEMMAAIRHDNGADVKSVSSYYDTNAATIAIKIEAFADLNDALDFSLHVGADSSDDNKINVNIAQMSARGLGINGLLVNGSGTEDATAAIDVIADALQKVSNQRATLGAVQNRLEHTIKNLDNIVENTTSAESAVRDTDMATQMVAYSNNNILAQAGQAMLAQSNQTNQGVLSLLG